MVDGERGHGAGHVGEALGLHLVDGVAREAGPGRRHVAEAAHLAATAGEGVLPLLGAVHGRRPRPLGVGPPGRLPAHLAPPGQEGGVGQVVPSRRDLLGHRRDTGRGPGRLRRGQCVGGAEHEGVGPVGQRQDDDHLPGLGPLEHVAQRHGAGRRAQIAHRPGQVGGERPVAHAETLRHGLDRPHVQADDDGVVDVALGHACVLERGGKGLAGQRHVHLLAEALLPDVRIGLTGHAPAVEELVAGRSPADQLRHRSVGRHRARRRRRRRCPAPRPSRPSRYAGPRRRAAWCACATQSQPQRPRGRPGRPGEVIGAAPAPQPQRRMHRGGARLVQVRRVGRRQEQVLHRGRPRAHGQRPPAGLDAQRGGVLVVGGHGPGAPAPAAAQDARDGRPLEPPIGQVGPPRNNPGAHGPIIPDGTNTAHIIAKTVTAAVALPEPASDLLRMPAHSAAPALPGRRGRRVDRGRGPPRRTDPSRWTYAVIPTMGWLRTMEPVEPRKGGPLVVGKVKIPPSEPLR